MEANGYYYVVRTLKLANYLANHGFQIERVKDSYENPKIKVFYFVKTPELVELVNKYTGKEVNKE